jgi:hypothetical protein
VSRRGREDGASAVVFECGTINSPLQVVGGRIQGFCGVGKLQMLCIGG